LVKRCFINNLIQPIFIRFFKTFKKAKLVFFKHLPLISLFTEMFGVPLTIYFLSGFFGLPLTLNSLHGHLLAATLTLLGLWTIETGVLVVMVISILMLFIAAYLII